MLSVEERAVGRCGLGSCDALELVKVLIYDFARHTINLGVDCALGEAVAMDCDQLAASQVAFTLGDTVDESDSLGLVAGSVVIVAPVHRRVHVLGEAYSELEIDLAGIIRHDVSHEPSDLVLCVGIQPGSLVYKAFEVDTVAVYQDLVEGQLGEVYILTTLGITGINPE